jgi:hypothetical protein
MKKVYGGIENAIPDGFKLLQLIKFIEKSKRPGGDYNHAVVLSQEHGVTFAAEEEGAF